MGLSENQDNGGLLSNRVDVSCLVMQRKPQLEVGDLCCLTVEDSFPREEGNDQGPGQLNPTELPKVSSFLEVEVLLDRTPKTQGVEGLEWEITVIFPTEQTCRWFA